MTTSIGSGGSDEARFTLRISKVTSMIIFTRKATVTFTGTYRDLETSYRNVLVYNLLLGWWGIPFGVIWTPIVLAQNRAAFKKLRELAAGKA